MSKSTKRLPANFALMRFMHNGVMYHHVLPDLTWIIKCFVANFANSLAVSLSCEVFSHLMVGQRCDAAKPFFTQVALLTTRRIMYALVFQQQKLICKLLITNSAHSLFGTLCRMHLRFMKGETSGGMKPFFTLVTRMAIVCTLHAIVFTQYKLIRKFLVANCAHAQRLFNRSRHMHLHLMLV